MPDSFPSPARDIASAATPTAGTRPAAGLSPSFDNPLVEPLRHREFVDIDGMRSAIFDGVLKAAKQKYPIENQRYQLHLSDLGYDSDQPFSLDEQKQAIMQGQTLQRLLKGKWQLVDKASGKIVDERASVIAHVPQMTHRGTFVYNGSEYVISNQARLKAGVYARVKDNGILESHINVKPGTGPSFRIYMEPATGIFRMGVGQSELKLYPIMRSMGVGDAELEKWWGKELLQRNIEAEDPRAVSRAVAKLVRTRADANAEERPDTEGADESAKAAEHRPKYPNEHCPICGSALGSIPVAQYGDKIAHRNCARRKRRHKWAEWLETDTADAAYYLLSQERARQNVGDGLLDGYEDFQKAASLGQLVELLRYRMQKRAETDADSGQMLKDVFEKMELDPAVTQLTLGKPYSKVNSEAILRASQKLLNISKGKEDVDDRDSLAFQKFMGPEDFFAERITKDAGQIGRKLLWKATLRGHLQHIPSGALTPQIYSVLLRSGMGSPLEETNPMEIFDQQLRVIRLGEGGIPSLDAIPDDSRAVQPSHYGFIDPTRSPESFRMGVDSRVTHGSVKGNDGRIYTTMINTKTGKPEIISAERASRAVVAFPGEMKRGGSAVRAMVKSHSLQYVRPEDVDYELPSVTQMFSANSNLVPMIQAVKAGRLMMGSRFINQALPLAQPEAPLVQAMDENGKSFVDLYSTRVGAVRSAKPGVVTKITSTGIEVRHSDQTISMHELYSNFPFNRKTFLNNTPAVKIGDQVKADQVLATSNYTDSKGSLALGTNLRTAYFPFRGLNYEDAVVVSESAAKKLASEHMYQHAVTDEEGQLDINRKSFVSLYPGKYKPEQMRNIGEDGLVKVGTPVQRGDPLMLALRRTRIDAIHRGRKPMFTDGAVEWEHDADGVVTDVTSLKGGGFNVVVKAYAPATEADKIAGFFGEKGVISQVVPDSQMPHDKDGRPLDLILNPLGVISRGNPAQVFEALLGKAARKRGQPYKLAAFGQGNLLDFVKHELAANGLTDTEDLTDPVTGRVIPQVLTGERFIMKMHHTAEAKGGGRDVGAYTSELQPAKGGEAGAKKIGTMELNALLAHGAVNVIRDAHLVRGQRNDDFWRLFRLGMSPPPPRQPFIYSKFLAFLRGSGVNLHKEGSHLHLLPLTDKDVMSNATGPLQNAETVSGDQMKPVEGGLFDEHLTGGHGGQQWSYIQLHEPIPNPIMEEPVRRLLGLTQKDFEAFLTGEKPINGLSGGSGVRELLKGINLDEQIRHYTSVVEGGSVSKRDDAVKVLGYLKTLKQHDLRPEDWVITKIPVLPPSMRTIAAFQGMQLTADPNYLYRDLFLVNQDLKELKGQVGDDGIGEERLRLYNAYKAVSGLGDPVQPKTVEKGVSGLLSHVFGAGSPKVGLFQARMIGTTTDVVGRATITPNPELSMDQVGLPEEKAWVIYRPFIMRRLVRKGLPAVEAAKGVIDRSPVARQALEEELKIRPVIINRAPTLHKFGFMAAWPILVKGHTLQVSPTVTTGFGADFDGDGQISTVIVCLTKKKYQAMLPKVRSWWSARRVTPWVTLGGLNMGRKQAWATVLQGHEAFAVELSEFPHHPDYLEKGHIRFHKVEPGLKTLALDEKTGQAVLADVTSWSEHFGQEIETVELTSGRQIYTDDDPRGVYGLDPETYEYVRRRPKDSVGLFVPKIANWPGAATTITSLPIPVSHQNIGETLFSSRLVQTMPLNRQMGKWLGLMVGDGWVVKAHDRGAFGIAIAALDAGVRECFMAGIRTMTVSPEEKFSEHQSLNSYGDSRRVVFSSVQMGRMLEPLIGHTAQKKHLPPCFLSAPPEFRLGLLEGLLDTDGSVSLSHGKAKPQLLVNFSSVSLRLIREVQLLLLTLGVRSRATASKTPAGEPYWMLNISTYDVTKLDLQLSHTAKQKVWKNRPDIPMSGAVRSHDLVPVSTMLATVLSAECYAQAKQAASQTDKTWWMTQYGTLRKALTSQAMSRETALQLVKKLKGAGCPEWPRFVALVHNAAIHWDRVKSYTPTGVKETGYDLTVPGYETFVSAEGIVLSNTMQYHVPVTDEAAREAAERMMPSRNLFSVKDFKVHYLPNQEFVMGLYLASTAKNSKIPPRVFAGARDALAAYRRGEIGAADRITVRDR